MKFKVNKKELKNLQDIMTLNTKQTRRIGGAGNYGAPRPRTNTTYPSFDG
ncbi:hypothetical protein [Pseudoalteromonas rubra]|nr:hypothetical protein [Pseudoalteromonas rubra]